MDKQPPTPSITEALALLNIKPTAQQVFTYLLSHGATAVAEIAGALNMPKSTIYDALRDLLEQSLVVEYSDERGKRFSTATPDEVASICKKKIAEITSASDIVTAFMQQTEQVSDVAKPKIRFYFGSDGIRQAFRETMWHEKCKETFLMWSTQEMVKILGPEFSQWHSEQRLRYKVEMYVIRKHSDRKMESKKSEHTPLVTSKGWSSDRHIRHAPKKSEWSMNYWIYDNTCLFAGSGREQFAFVVHSKEFAELMKLLWGQMWEVSEE